MAPANPSASIVECHLWIEELLKFDFLRDGVVCISCSAVLGAHTRAEGRESVIQSSKHCQTDSQSGETHAHEPINQQQIQSTITKDALISPPDNPQFKRTSSYSSQSISSSTSSIKSRGSSGALVRIHTAPVVSESETAKQTAAMTRLLKKQAVAEAAEARLKKIKLFLSKYCCSEYINSDDLYQKLMLALNNDHKRFYHLVQHARYNGLGLIQFANTTDHIVRIFELMNDIIPFEN